MPRFAPTKQRALIFDRFPLRPKFIGSVAVPASTGTGFTVTPHAETRIGDLIVVMLIKKDGNTLTTIPANFAERNSGTFTGGRLSQIANAIDVEPGALTFGWTNSVAYIAVCLTYRYLVSALTANFLSRNGLSTANVALSSAFTTTRPLAMPIMAIATINSRTCTPPAYGIERFDGAGGSGPSLSVWDYVVSTYGVQPNDNSVLSSSDTCCIAGIVVNARPPVMF
jgi:hypothetical protein